MPRRPRRAMGGYVYHVLNRAARRDRLFDRSDDYAAFARVLESARDRVPMRLLAYCVMPNHWHLVLWPRSDGDLSQYLRWLTVTHTQRWHAAHHTSGTGPLYQGRFKSFPVQEDEYFFAVCRYVERNALRAGLVARSEDWPWGSLRQEPAEVSVTLDAGPLARPANWRQWVNQPRGEEELQALRRAVRRGCPYGQTDWQQATAERLSLQSTLRPPGRPRKR